MIKKIYLLFIAWRLFLFLPLIASQSFLGFRTGFEYTRLTYFLSDKTSILSNFLLYPSANFDGVYYLLIAAKGYTVNAGFFPLFPLSIHIATLPFHVLPFDLTQYFSAISLVSFYFLIALVIFYKLIRLDYKESVAIWSIVFLLIFPTSFFYASIYSESLFLLLSLLTFYSARKKRWFWVGIAGALLTATRPVGISILPALLYDYFKEKNKSLSQLIFLLLTPLGLFAYALYNFLTWKNPFYFISVHGNFHNNRSVNSIVLPTQTLFRYLKILTNVSPKIYEWWVAFFELSFFILTLSLLYIAWKKKVRLSYLLFGLLCLIIPSLGGTLNAIPRYVLIIFPLFITLALIKNRVFKIVYSVISVILLFLFFMLFSKGYFIS